MPHVTMLHACVCVSAPSRYTSALKALDKLLASDDKAAASGAARREVSDLKCRWGSRSAAKQLNR